MRESVLRNGAHTRDLRGSSPPARSSACEIVGRSYSCTLGRRCWCWPGSSRSHLDGLRILCFTMSRTHVRVEPQHLPEKTRPGVHVVRERRARASRSPCYCGCFSAHFGPSSLPDPARRARRQCLLAIQTHAALQVRHSAFQGHFYDDG